MTPICPYCLRESVHRPASEVYGAGIPGFVYECRPCFAVVTCQIKAPTVPRGTLANRELRRLRLKAHKLYDPLWFSAHRILGWSKQKARDTGYRWMAKQLGIPYLECHIAMMDVATVTRLIKILEAEHEKVRKVA